MKKLSFPKLHVPHIKFINKTVVLLMVAGFIFVAVFVYGAVRSVQAQHVKEQEQATAKLQADKVAAAHQAEVSKLENELTTATAAKSQACGQLVTLKANKIVGKLVTVPASCNL